jgi:hypothetical protein
MQSYSNAALGVSSEAGRCERGELLKSAPSRRGPGRRRLASGVVSALFIVALGVAAPVRADQEYIETQDLRIVYFDPGGAPLVPHVTQSFLSGLAEHKSLFDYDPDGRVNVFLKDFTDRANAVANVAPRNRILMDIAASNDPYETISVAEPFASTAVHELTHLVMQDGASPADARFRRLFHGKVDVDAAHPESLLYYYLTVPRATAPRWFQEGGAVFMETWMGGGVGRAQGGYDEMVFRAMVHDDASFYDPLGLVSKGTEIDFQTGANAYLYGTRFVNYLALTYSPERLLSWWRHDGDRKRYYADDFKRVFGLPLDESWQNWIKWEHQFQQKNLSVVNEHPVTQFRDLTKNDLGAVSRSYLSADGSKLYAAVKYPGQVAHIVSISRKDGAVTWLAELKGPTGYSVASLAYDPRSATLFYTTNNNTYRNIEALDLRSGKSRTLLRGARIGDLAFNPADRSLWGIRLNRGFAMLVRVPFPYKEWQTLHVFPLLEKAFDLDVSPDGTLASMSVSGAGATPSSPQVTEVRIMRTDALAKGDATSWRKFAMGDAVPEGFVFSKDGRYLYGSSFYTGVSNIFRYEIGTGALAAVSNAELGFFRPLPVDDAKLIVLRYTAKGFAPATIEATPTEDLSAVSFLGTQVAKAYPVVKTWSAAPPSTIAYQSQIIGSGEYRPFRELSLESLIPVVEGFQNSAALGASARFGDPLSYDSLDLDASYSPDGGLSSKERPHFSADFHHTRWTVGVRWNGADFYDLFGPTKYSRAGENDYVNYNLPLIFNPPETLDFNAKVAYYADLDALPGFQNVPSPSKNLSTAEAGLASQDTRSSPGAVDAETGHSWSIAAHTYGALGEIFPSLFAQFDIGFPLPLNHSSIWLRTGAGISGGERTSPLANSYLGGFGNNYVDNEANGGAQRYRDLLSMPGFDLDALHGTSLAKAMLEWCLPPLRFEALGSPGFYASWARPEIFFSALETNPVRREFRGSAEDVGAQLDFQLQVMHRMPMMLSVGVARGFAGGGLGRTEFMLSFQVL